MAVITPPSITALPSPPNPAVRSTFNALAYPWSVALGPYSTELAAVASNVEHNASEAATSATTAATQAGNAATSAGTATTQAGIATAQAVLAAASAASASNAANVNGTSTDSESIPTIIGQQRTFTMVESSRDIVPGMFLVAAVTASPTTNWALFQVDSFAANAWTGTCKAFGGSGTFSAWTVSLASARGPAGADAITRTPSLALSGTPTLTAGNNGYTGDVAAGTAIAFDTLATLGDGWNMILFPDTSGAASSVTADFGAGAVTRTLATPTMVSVKLVSGTYTVRWVPFGGRRKDFGAYGAAAVFLAASVSSQIQVVSLSATLALVVYVRNSDSKIYAVALSVDAVTGAVTPGTPVLVENVTIAGTSLQLIALSATDAVVTYAEGTNTKIKAMVLQVLSGTTVTTNSTSDIESAATAVSLSLVYLSATKLAVLYVHASSLNTFGRTLDISGTAVTVNGSNTLVTGGGSSTVTAVALSAALGVVFYNATLIRQFTVSGSTIAMSGDGFSVIGASQNGALVALSASRFLAHIDVSASVSSVTRATALFEVDGTDVYSLGALNHHSPSYQPPVLLKQAVDQAIAFRTSTYPDIAPQALDIQDGKVLLAAVGRPIIPPRTTVYFNACLLSATRALIVYTDPTNSNYGTAKTLNLGSAAA